MDKDKVFTFLDDKEYPSRVSSRKGSARRLIVFILGGITYTECRVAYEVAASYKTCDIIVGGSKILTPNDFINDLKDLNKQAGEVRHSNLSLSEQIPLLDHAAEQSNNASNDAIDNFIATCERYLLQSGRLITESLGKCTSNVCGTR